MLRLAANLLLGGASSACGFAAVAVALYAGSPAQASAATLFAGFGFVAGLLCGALHAVVDGLPAQPAAAMPPEALASLVRATLASAVAERAPRTGSAADRRPTPAQLASAVLAEAAVTSLAEAPAAAPRPLSAAVPAALAALAAPAAAVAMPPPGQARRFAPSEFGA